MEVFTFLAKTIIGLNIHLCCLIERLIKKEEIVSHINIVDFEKNNQEFIYVLNNYKTDMSIDEI